MWLETLTGFCESDVDEVGAQFVVDREWLISRANNRRMRCGRFETPSVGELRSRVTQMSGLSGRLKVREVVGNVQDLHTEESNAGALFQVASQFNTLEMISPSVSPEDGIERYESDRTQGPACAIACGAGTIYRNYLVDVDGQRGQSAARQINCLADLAVALGVSIDTRNGYALPTEDVLSQIGQTLAGCSPADRDGLMAQLRVGLQWDTEVTLRGAGHLVTQVYCSALPVAYSSLPAELWDSFARLVLDAAYEATFAASVLNASATGNNRVFLTLLGGGAFGNQAPWILDALKRSLDLYTNYDLDLAVVSYGRSNPEVQRLLAG